MIQRVLVAVDHSECGRAALSTACDMAEAMGAEMVLVHAVTPFLPPKRTDPNIAAELAEAKASVQEDAAIDLTELAEQARGRGINVTPVIEERDPAELILQAAADHKVDMVVVGTHRRKGLQRLLLGSVASEILQASPCAVVVVPTHGKGGPASASQ